MYCMYTCTACITVHFYRVTCCEVTHSLTHSGKKLQELFPRRQSDGDVFQEPPEAHTKLRWQVVQVIFQETGAMSEETGFIARETAERRESDIEAEFLPSRASRLLQTESQDLVPGESLTPSQLGLCGVNEIHGLLSWMAGVGFEGIKTTSDIVLRSNIVFLSIYPWVQSMLWYCVYQSTSPLVCVWVLTYTRRIMQSRQLHCIV